MTNAGLAFAVLAWAALIVVAFSLARIAAQSDQRITRARRPIPPPGQPGAASSSAPGAGDTTTRPEAN